MDAIGGRERTAVGGSKRIERRMKDLEHELQERGRRARLVARCQRLVVRLLPRADDRFKRQLGQHRVFLAQDDLLPQPPHATVAIEKGMNGSIS